MTAQEKIIEVERQVRAMSAGTQEAKFTCPFCSLESGPENGLLCCNEAAEVVSAVLDHLEHIERCSVIERTMDRFAAIKDKAIFN